MTESTGKMLLRIAPMTYGPNILFGLGEGAMLPIIPVIAANLGASLAMAGLIASMIVVGRMVGNLPAGWMVSRFGEKWSMIAGASVGTVATVFAALAPTLGVFTIAIFVIGVCDAAFAIARHAFMTTRVPLHFRARAISLLGGSSRFGVFVGPFIAALLISLTGSELSTAWFFVVMFAGTILLVALGPDPEAQFDEEVVTEETLTHAGATVPAGESSTREELPPSPHGDEHAGVLRTMVNYRGVLGRLGLAAAALSAVRAAQQVVLPLWGVSIGLEAHTLAIIIGVAGAVDFALFYVSGQVMDRFGRLWAAFPASFLMGVGFTALAFTHDLDNAVAWFTALACLISLGNGLSSGILMTLGADVAPIRNPAPFLGSWHALTDAGGALAPLLYSGIAAVTILAVPTAVMGVIGFAGAAGFVRWVPRFVPRKSHQPGRQSDSERPAEDGDAASESSEA